MNTPIDPNATKPTATSLHAVAQTAARAQGVDADNHDNVVALRMGKSADHAGASQAAEIALPLMPVLAAVTVDDPKARWKLLIGPAKLRWSKLTDAELQKTEGNEHQLAVLVQFRYDIPRGDAYRQVKSFHELQKA